MNAFVLHDKFFRICCGSGLAMLGIRLARLQAPAMPPRCNHGTRALMVGLPPHGWMLDMENFYRQGGVRHCGGAPPESA